MQTFVPFDDLLRTMRVLDRARLGKQRVEAYQILATLLPIPTLAGTARLGWRNHPAVKMWRGHETALASYGLAACTEWSSRGYADNMAPAFELVVLNSRSPKPSTSEWSEIHDSLRAEAHERAARSSLVSVRRTLRWAESLSEPIVDRGLPDWWGRADVHASHRAVLRVKDPDWYAPRFEIEPSVPAEYVWPA